jgi:hypothetical protein
MAGGVRIGIAFDDATLEPSPTWTYLTDEPNLVAGYTKDVGRQFEFDRPDTGTGRIFIFDADGLLDPTNLSSPYVAKIVPLLQIKGDLWNPVTSTYTTRFRGFIRDYNYTVMPFTHQHSGETVGMTTLEIEWVDLFEILTAIEMQPGAFGDDPLITDFPDIFFEDRVAHDRATDVLDNAGIPGLMYQVFTLNVRMRESVYSASENVLQVLQDVADAEFPTLGIVYVDRLGRLALHGREARFSPDTTATGAGSAWTYHHWKAGDEQAVRASITDTAQIREFAYNLGLSKIFNSAFCTPMGILPADVAAQHYKDDSSIGQYGYRSWSAENLLIDSGTTTGLDALGECFLFSTFIVENFKVPRNRITQMTFRSMHPDDDRAAANWKLLCECDIADSIDVTVDHPGEGGFFNEPCFIEGIHETANPLNGEYADVTISLDVSLQSYFSNDEGLIP